MELKGTHQLLNYINSIISQNIKKLNSVALVRERTIPTERPPLVGEVSANFLRIESVALSAQRIPTVVNIGFLDRLVKT
jgi:hypothetical protein